MSICVCAKCKKPWKVPSSPARCPDCGEVSFAIAIEIGSQAITAGTRAKLSASSKKLWQDPEYRARQIATHTGRHPSPETKAKISAALTRWHNRLAPESVVRIGNPATAETRATWQNPEYRAKVSGTRNRKPLTAETKAKISATLTGRPLPAETRAKMSAAHIGKPVTAETKAKLSAAMKRWHNRLKL